MELTEFIKNRRSVRKYTSQSIDNELLDELLEATCRAPNTGNMQAYSIVLTTDLELKKRLALCHFNQPSIVQAPAVLTFCADFNRFEKWCEQRNAQAGYRNFQSFFTAGIDALLAAQTFCLAAEMRGLGTCFFGTTTYTTAQIIEVLNLPTMVVPVITLTVGYPDGESAQVDRLPLEGIVHRETYRDYTEADINRIYARKESLPENRHFIEENGKETLAQVFTDVRYTKANNETFSKTFLEAIQKQGFSFPFLQI